MMKVSLLIFTLFLSNLSIAQSILVLGNGKMMTVDDQGMISDSGSSILLEEVRNMGGRFIIDKDRRIRTVDRAGFLYTKDKQDKAPIKIEHFGDNFFISKLGRIFTIDEQGQLYEGESKEKEFRNVKIRGGNFLIAQKKVDSEKTLALFVVTHFGKVIEVNVPGLNLESVLYAGGQYFITDRGTIYTITNDGQVFLRKDVGSIRGHEMRMGGNYFFTDSSLYTISQAGILSAVGMTNDFGRVRAFGTNFFVTQDNRLFTISSSGNVRSVPTDFSLSTISLFSQL